VRSLARIAAAVAAALVVVAPLAGCGGDDGGTADDATAGLTPTELLARSADAYRELDSLRVAFEVTGTADLGSAASGVLGETVDVSGEALVRPPDELAMDATVNVAGLPLQANLTRTGDEVVIDALGRSIALELDPATLEYLDFGAAYPELTEWVTEPVVEPGGDVGGTTTVAVRGPLDQERVVGALAPLLGDAVRTDAPAGAVTGTATINVGVEDLLPRRVVVVITGNAGALAPGAGALDLTLAADASDFDTSDTVTLPAADERLTIDRLARLLGR
jgi:hypothetical protein